jgi:putative transposase
MRASSGAPTSSLSFPAAALLRLAGSVLVETHDEWQVSERRYLSEGSMALLDTTNTVEEVAPPALLTA